MNPCDIGTLTQKCLLAQKSVESTPKRVIAPLCAPVTRNRKVCHFRCGFRFFFPWVWAGLFLLPDQNIKATILRGKKMFFHSDQNWRYFWKSNSKTGQLRMQHLESVQSLSWANDHHRFLCFQWWRLSAVRCLQWAFPCWRLPWPGPFCRCSKARRRPDSGPRRRAACVWFPVRYHHTVIVILSLNCTSWRYKNNGKHSEKKYMVDPLSVNRFLIKIT